MSDKKEITKLLSFMATFDGGIYRPGGSKLNAFFRINFSKENLDYVLWVKETLEQITSTQLADVLETRPGSENWKPAVRLVSRRHPFLTTLHDRIYIDGKKVLDLHMLRLLDAEALAIIFMADGTSFMVKGTSRCILNLCTKGFSEADNLALSKAIYDRLNIRSSVKRDGKYFYLSIKSTDILRFVYLVRPHIKPSFLYKLERIAPALEYLTTKYSVEGEPRG